MNRDNIFNSLAQSPFYVSKRNKTFFICYLLLDTLKPPILPMACSFSASTVHLEHLTTALQCLVPFGSKDDVLIYIDSEGLSLVRRVNRVIRIQLLLSRELFASYHYENDSGSLSTRVCLKINHLLDSVNLVYKNSDDIVECTMHYEGPGTPFELIFEDTYVSERVQYSTYLIKELDDWERGLEIDKTEIVMEALIRGDVLHAAIKSLKEINCKDCYLYAQPAGPDGISPILALISKSSLGLSKINLPINKSILEKLDVKSIGGRPVIGFFNFQSFDKIRSSVKIASKVLIRLDGNGLLSVNILSHTDNIIMADTRAFRTPKSSIGNTELLQLPKEYPGIVIEVCMLEKDKLDGVSIDELVTFMHGDSTEMNHSPDIETKGQDGLKTDSVNNHDSSDETNGETFSELPIFF